MSGPHQAPTAQNLQSELTLLADRLNGSENLSSEDFRLVRHLTDIYRDAVQQNHQEGFSGTTLRAQFNTYASERLIRDWNRTEGTTLNAREAQQLVNTVDRAMSQALVPNP